MSDLQNTNIYDNLIKFGSFSAAFFTLIHIWQLNLDREERAWDPESSFRTRTEYGRLQYCEEYTYYNKSGHYEWDKNYEPSWEEVYETISPETKNGCWAPKNCLARQQTIIVVPFRKREKHLKLLLYKLHPFLQSQMIDYCIIVSEQYDGGMFNTGMLKNAGFLEGVKGVLFENN